MPDLSIAVEEVDALYQRTQALGRAIVHPLTDKPWGVRWFCLRDPAGKLLNVLSHRP